MRAQKDAAAIIVAGGQGARFGGRIRKQYLRLGGRPLLWWSLKAFDQSPSIGAMVLVVPAEDLSRLRRMIRAWKMRKPNILTAGGATRADSVREGLKKLPSSVRWVAVHDAVRPLVTVDLIERTLLHARRSRAAIAAMPSKDTVKLASSGLHVPHIKHSPPRESVWLAQTPQIFERSLLEKAHGRYRSLTVTDDSQLVERLGVRVRLVESSAENLKVTRPLDLEIAKMVLKTRAAGKKGR